MLNRKHAAQGFSSETDCQTLVVALRELSNSIQELAADPSTFVLHRTQCCALAKSYMLTVRHVTDIFSQESACALDHLRPSLSELRHVMIQGSKFIRDCRRGDEWVKKALLLDLSTEAQDVCLHDLVWCLCVIQQAMGYMVLNCDDLQRSVFAPLDAIWAETSQKQDLDDLLESLQREIAFWENELSGKDLSKRSRKKLVSYCSQAKFLLEKLSSKDHLDDKRILQWANPDEFTIKEIVGRGAFGVVSKVKWQGQLYGEKEFFGVEESDFTKEAAIQAQLRHPNLLQLVCCLSKQSKNSYSLVMELMHMDLRRRIDERLMAGFNPPFPLLTSVDIMLQIAKGMEHLHSLRVMHRDLKAANLLVSDQMPTNETSSECRMRVKIADFGMSKVKNQSSKYTSLQAGTTYWRAPEVFDVHPESEFQGESTAKYTKKADVYSFAMVCFEILTGKIPFADGGKLCDLHQKLLNGERPTLPPSCPAYLVSLISKCWHGDPVQRPTFAQISRALRHFKGFLHTRMADPETLLTLSAGTFTEIEENLVKKMGPQWASTVSGWYSTHTMTISFEMSWYQEHIGTERSRQSCSIENNTLALSEADKAAQMPSIQMTPQEPISLSVRDISRHNGWMKHGVNVSLKQFRLLFGIERKITGPGDERGGRIPRTGLERFRYSELALATATFDESAKVQKDGWGRVYAGRLVDGREVAVKVISESRTVWHKSFYIELELGSRISHVNFLRLLGYCNDKHSHILVYEYMSRGDLGQWLFGERQALVLSWAQRYEIACGVASALDYLHNGLFPPVVHRNVKPSNIWLDGDFKARLSDLSLAVQQELEDEYHDRICGTWGYMDPEYYQGHRLGPAADVFGYGVVLLQLVTGRKAFDWSGTDEDMRFVDMYVSKLVDEGRHLDAVDERLRVDGYLDNQGQIRRVIELGLMCCQYKQSLRPCMSEVVQTLREVRKMES